MPPQEAQGTRSAPLSEVLATVLEATTARLAAEGRAAVVDGELDPVFEAHVTEILTQAWNRLESLRDSGYLQAAPSLDLAHMQATADVIALQSIHPAEPLLAASAVFELALPELTRALPVDPVQVALVLHESVFARFVPGALAFTEALRVQLGQAEWTTRARVARQLEQDVLPGLSAAHTRLAAAALSAADARAAGVDVRVAFSELRALVIDASHRPDPEDQLAEALRTYALAAYDGRVSVAVAELGETQTLPAASTAALLEITVEAIRNARRHAQASRVDVVLQWRPASLVVTIADDGGGTDAAAASRPPLGTGLAGIRARAALLSSRLTFDSDAQGTTLSLRCPLPARG